MGTMSMLAGKVALITGASSGIGAATAIHFARCEEGGMEPLIIQADVNNEEDCKRILDLTVEKFGSLDVLVNNAGVLEMGTIENITLEQYDRVMNTNMRSVLHLSMLAVPHLIKTQGNIVNVSSVNGIRSFPGVLAYNISKAALDQFTRCAALELASKKVRVNSVNPGVIVTELQKTGGLDEQKYSSFLEHSKSTHAMGRVGDPEEVAKAISFLASNDASFSTGVCLPVDGGRHAMCPR